MHHKKYQRVSVGSIFLCLAAVLSAGSTNNYLYFGEHTHRHIAIASRGSGQLEDVSQLISAMDNLLASAARHMCQFTSKMSAKVAMCMYMSNSVNRVIK